MSKDTTKVQIHGKGNYTYITVPRGIQKQIQYKQGQSVKFIIDGDKIILEKV